MNEKPIVFESNNKYLTGIVHHALGPNAGSNKGVIIVVGGPQTRVGSHRQFVLLARLLASNGVNVLRFDYTGIGDSEGALTDFLSAAQDFDAAITELSRQCPKVDDVTLWGLCDGASAILLYLSQHQSPLIKRIVIANPWVEQQQSKAKTVLKHYYLQRFLSPIMWRKILTGKFDFLGAVSGVFSALKLMLPSTGESQMNTNTNITSTMTWPTFTNQNYVMYMKQGLVNFSGSGGLVLSGQDLVAKEFLLLVDSDDEWQQLLSKKIDSRLDIALSNHTFSSAAWRGTVEKFTLDTIFTSKDK